ncbi:hypothetical protein A6395_00425 [Exiguobacterium sp. SH31]|uniref:hypothetical protein n=1 Tax=unclassified Exiguobacterium TaxID=2644629 RepID=UPI0008ACCA11|nr:MULTISPECIES: hypothetical protein [unclassified Exiguobacterium]OGX80640.1 hypothetical protein A6395_00425 [Exiguobacterium sp. SH31]TCI69851.1 hypothetical protein EVJ22_09935 [Exiguobacterium sp. SH0S7]
MIKTKTIFFLSLCLIAIGLFGSLVLDATGFFSNPTARVISIPIASNEGYFIEGLLVLTVTLLGLFVLPFTLKRNKALITAVFLSAVILIPQLV